MPRPSADLHMPPPPPRLPPLYKGGSGQFSAGSTPKVTLVTATDDDHMPPARLMLRDVMANDVASLRTSGGRRHE